jgi:hypothetical protein
MNHIFKPILISVFLILSQQTLNSYSQYDISPSLPPSAFIGQYYTCQFRASGLKNPSFSFENLPSFLTASSNGAIEGIPTDSGSYSITVSYQQGGEQGQQDVVLRVTEPNFNTSLSRNVNVSKQNLNWIQLSAPSTYKVGDPVSINLSKNAENNNYTWSYLQLPEML